jgi:hypothetical protein
MTAHSASERKSSSKPSSAKPSRAIFAMLGAALLLAGLASPSRLGAAFHVAVIGEILTSYNGNASSQFVEIDMLAGGQGTVVNTKLTTFDTDGNFVEVVLDVLANVPGGAANNWIMGTPQFVADSGLAVNFTFPGGLPTAGGMVCWGRPADETLPTHYVDCIAYGTYNGPTNVFIGTPTSLTPNGHTLRRIGITGSSAADFECADPGNPENVSFETVDLPATTPCPVNCADPIDDDDVTATDALFALAAAVGAQTCAACLCDVDHNGAVTASDALRILAFAVGQPVTVDCPLCG